MVEDVPRRLLSIRIPRWDTIHARWSMEHILNCSNMSPQAVPAAEDTYRSIIGRREGDGTENGDGN